MANQNDPQRIVPLELVREQLKGVQGGASSSRLWIKEPESQEEDRTLLPARLCSCSSVCLAVIEDR